MLGRSGSEWMNSSEPDPDYHEERMGGKIQYLTIRSDIRDRVADGGNQHIRRQIESTYPSLWIGDMHHSDYVKHAIRLCNAH